VQRYAGFDGRPNPRQNGTGGIKPVAAITTTTATEIRKASAFRGECLALQNQELEGIS